MNQQPERFAIRSRIIRDLKISSNAYRLFTLLDDEAHGEERIAMKQTGEDGLSKTLGITDRQLRRLISELEGGRYLRVYHTKNGNVYEFYRTKMSGRADKNVRSGGQKCPAYLITQESIQEPPTPFGEDKNQNPGACPECFGAGYVLVPLVTRGQSHNERRVCRCARVEQRA